MIDWNMEIHKSCDRALQGIPASNLLESIRYSLLSEGKLFRPRLMEASAELLGVSKSAIVPFGIALEMLHCFTLIHDDLPCMDDDDFRRGRPSNHKVFGEAIALLAGDSLISLAFELCLESQSTVHPMAWNKAFKRLVTDSGPKGVIGGQALELLLQDNLSLTLLRDMHTLKTGALFNSAVLIPADIAQIQQDSQKMLSLTRFASAFGLAFQTADDLEDAIKEKNPDTGSYPKTSILSYLPECTAREQASGLLLAAIEEVKSQWPSTHDFIVNIANKLIGTLN